MTVETATAEQIASLSGEWCASYSGGKDSTALVTWIEWLRRSGQLQVARPTLVQSDTGVEEPHLQAISRDMVEVLRASGWKCAMVEPRINEKLYNRILGIGNTPVCRALMKDILPITKRLVDIYNVSLGQDALGDWVDREVSAARFGCNGCPAISSERHAPKSTVKRNGPESPLNEIYDVWFEARRRDNRLINPKTGGPRSNQDGCPKIIV